MARYFIVDNTDVEDDSYDSVEKAVQGLFADEDRFTKRLVIMRQVLELNFEDGDPRVVL